MPSKRIFLCHSSSDKVFVDRLASDLEKTNIGVWYDKWEIKVGDSLIDKIQEGLMVNDYLAIILSPESVASDWVKKELNAALIREIKEKKVIVLPCLLCDCDIPPFLSDKKYANFKGSFEEGFADLLPSIFPESKEAVLKSKNFRVVQYLLSGLTNTDDAGTNILNAHQLKKVYHFRKELKQYLGLDEKKLLFWSIVAFKKANPRTPDFINNHVPLWGLINEVDDLTLAKWILEGSNSHIFSYVAKYFNWALSTNPALTIDMARDACFNAIKSQDATDKDHPFPYETTYYFFSLMARYRPSFLKDNFLDKTPPCHSLTPILVDASTEFSEKLGDSYYMNLLDSNPKLIINIIKALIKLKRTSSIDLFKEH